MIELVDLQKCEACWERYRRTRPIFRIGLCRDCFFGRTGMKEEQQEFRARQAAATKRAAHENILE